MATAFALAPVVVILVSALTAVTIFLLPERASRARARINLTAAVLKLALIVAVVPFVFDSVYP
ncbi:MAG: hypothetical protein Q4F67_11725, partial [Propionibacteriaceae bacterium]|nr:hypothetical protein [Propionibacteriaceae bacterium]